MGGSGWRHLWDKRRSPGQGKEDVASDFAHHLKCTICSFCAPKMSKVLWKMSTCALLVLKAGLGAIRCMLWVETLWHFQEAHCTLHNTYPGSLHIKYSGPGSLHNTYYRALHHARYPGSLDIGQYISRIFLPLALTQFMPWIPALSLYCDCTDMSDVQCNYQPKAK